MVPTSGSHTIWTDGKTHLTMLGANDSAFRNLLLANLGGPSDMIDGTCADLEFSGMWLV